MSEPTTHHQLEGLAAELASAIEGRRRIEDRLRAQVHQIVSRLAPSLREAAAAERDCADELRNAVEANPGLFAKPRTRTVHGIKYGWQTGKPKISIPDEPKSIRLIRERLPEDQAALLIRTTESIVKPAVLDLTAQDLRRIAIQQEPGEETVIVKAMADSVDRLVQTLLADNAKQSEEAA